MKFVYCVSLDDDRNSHHLEAEGRAGWEEVGKASCASECLADGLLDEVSVYFRHAFAREKRRLFFFVFLFFLLDYHVLTRWLNLHCYVYKLVVLSSLFIGWMEGN